MEVYRGRELYNKNFLFYYIDCVYIRCKHWLRDLNQIDVDIIREYNRISTDLTRY